MSPTDRQATAPPPYPFPSAAAVRWDPPSELAGHRVGRGIVEVEFDGGPAWLLTRYADIRAALADPLFVPHIPGVAITPDQANQSGLLFLMHGQPHRRLRRVLSRAMSARRVAALRPAVVELARSALAELSAHGPPADLMRTYAGPLAAGTLSELLGVDLAERAGFEAMISDTQSLFSASDPTDAARSGEQLAGFLARLIHERRAAPGPDLLSELVTATAPDGEPLTDAEVDGLVFSLLGAGLVPPAQAMALATLRLLDDPETAAMLRQDPARIPAAVDELLRLDPAGAASTDRSLRATGDADLDGTHIPAGSVVVLPFGAANRDPAEFPDPHALRLDRPSSRHLSFSPGVHHCLGAALARLQLEIGLEHLLAHLPGLALAVEPDSLDWRHGMVGARNLASLPVTWSAST